MQIVIWSLKIIEVFSKFSAAPCSGCCSRSAVSFSYFTLINIYINIIFIIVTIVTITITIDYVHEAAVSEFWDYQARGYLFLRKHRTDLNCLQICREIIGKYVFIA